MPLAAASACVCPASQGTQLANPPFSVRPLSGPLLVTDSNRYPTDSNPFQPTVPGRPYASWDMCFLCEDDPSNGLKHLRLLRTQRLKQFFGRVPIAHQRMQEECRTGAKG